MTLRYSEVAEILKIIDASECEELVLELEGVRLVVRRRGAGAPAVAGEATPTPAATAPPTQPATTASATPAASATATADPLAEGDVLVRAPMVGTFYRRPAPDQPVFVEEGATVRAGDPVCLIEVMKLYTTIEAGCDGTVVAVAVEDGALVEFNQPLFTIRRG